MKRFFLILISCFVAFVASAQNNASSFTSPSAPEQAVPIVKTDWLRPFNSVKIDGPMKVVFTQTDAPESVRIIYDTKGSIDSKFKFEIDKKGTLVVSERPDPKRTELTEVTIYYNSLSDIKIAHAKAEFTEKIQRDILDLSVSGGAIVSLEIETLDVAIECTGQSRLSLTGSTKYLTMRASTAKIDCSGLSTVSSTIDGSNSAEIRLVVSERLEATTSTGAKLLYKGHPIILRDHAVIFGGDIININ